MMVKKKEYIKYDLIPNRKCCAFERIFGGTSYSLLKFLRYV